MVPAIIIHNGDQLDAHVADLMADCDLSELFRLIQYATATAKRLHEKGEADAATCFVLAMADLHRRYIERLDNAG